MISLKLFSDKGTGLGARCRALVLLISILCPAPFLLSACATKKIEMPSYKGIEPKDMLAGKENIKSLVSTFSIEFERDGVINRGDAVLRLNHGDVDVQVYSFGMLVAEVSSTADFIRSVPPIDKTKLSLLVDGLSNSFLWWSIKNPDITDEGGMYLVSNSWRRLFINKKTMQPIKQIIELEDGRQLKVFYGEPDLIGGVWFPSKMRVELSSHSVNLEIKTLSMNPL